VRIWKAYSHVPTNPIVVDLVDSVISKKFTVKAKQLTIEMCKEKDISDYLKISHTLVV